MLAIAAVFFLAITNPSEVLEATIPDAEVSEMEWVFEEEETDLQNEEIVFDDSLLIDSEQLELEE